MIVPRPAVASLLREKYLLYNTPQFIKEDPISVPHRFTKAQDIEIAGLFAATFAWGNRKAIINSCTSLMNAMDNSPYEFIVQHTESDLKRLFFFKHRTFNTTDLLYFIHFLRTHYHSNVSLETAFASHITPISYNTERALRGFYDYFFSLPEAPKRTKKHVSTPARKSACKRLNMFLRWMVRKDSNGVDFGLWKNIQPHQLIIPLDVHVHRVALYLGLVNRRKADWQAALELTESLKHIDSNDPAKFDYALFGLGVIEKYG